MEYTIIIILVALLQYTFFTMRVGIMRGKFEVDAPKTVGNETWERMYRVQENTLEQLVIFIPTMVTFQMYVSEQWVLLPGIAFVIGRQLYSHLYINDPKSRTAGMAISLLSNTVLLVGSLIGIGMKLMG